MAKEERNGKWAVIESYWAGKINKFTKKYHFFHTEEEAINYKAKSDIAWAKVNTVFPFTMGRQFTIQFIPCEDVWETEECSRPTPEQLAKLHSTPR